MRAWVGAVATVLLAVGCSSRTSTRGGGNGGAAGSSASGGSAGSASGGAAGTPSGGAAGSGAGGAPSGGAAGAAGVGGGSTCAPNHTACGGADACCGPGATCEQGATCELVITTFEDSYADASQPASTHGVSAGIVISDNPDSIGYIKPTGFGIHAVKLVTTAVIELDFFEVGCTVKLHEVTNQWAESSLSWTIKPSHQATAMATLYVGSLGYKSLSLDTPLVLTWLKTGLSNGVALTSAGSSSDVCKFRSSEYSGQKPRIKLTYPPF